VVATVGFASISLILGLAFADSTTTLDALLLIMLYLLVPWTAINLTDYFLLRRGHYDVAALFTPDGVYGAWAAPGLLAYFVGVAAQLPFMVLPFFVGPAAVALGRVDISFVVGLAVSATSYAVLARRAGILRLPNI
jgi:purine-cytosine permease-like protein